MELFESSGNYAFALSTRKEDIFDTVKASNEKEAFIIFTNKYCDPDKNYSCQKVLEYDNDVKCWFFVFQLVEFRSKFLDSKKVKEYTNAKFKK